MYRNIARTLQIIGLQSAIPHLSIPDSLPVFSIQGKLTYREWPNNILLYAILRYPEMKDLFLFSFACVHICGHMFTCMCSYVCRYTCVHVHVEAKVDIRYIAQLFSTSFIEEGPLTVPSLLIQLILLATLLQGSSLCLLRSEVTGGSLHPGSCMCWGHEFWLTFPW